MNNAQQGICFFSVDLDTCFFFIGFLIGQDHAFFLKYILE